MRAAKSFGALAVAVGLVLGSIGLFSAHEAVRIRRAAHVSAADVKEYSISPYVYRGTISIGVGAVLLLIGIVGLAQKAKC